MDKIRRIDMIRNLSEGSEESFIKIHYVLETYISKLIKNNENHKCKYTLSIRQRSCLVAALHAILNKNSEREIMQEMRDLLRAGKGKYLQRYEIDYLYIIITSYRGYLHD